ncbi:MAG TPA: universal stress protein [Paracoccus sp. (in: a-proteobacteria)]|nr:universal stress protein [Paracoccus sp. (in: a-proteobacteria)]
MFRTLNLVVTDSTRDTPALAVAAAIALREDAHLDISCLGVEPLPLDTMAMDIPPITVGWGLSEARDQAEALVSWARSHLPADLRARVEPVTVPALGLASAAAQLARLSDLVVMRRPYGTGVGQLAPILGEGLLFGTVAPFLIVPDEDRTDWSRPFSRICLAWDDSDEALRAAHAALPLLRAAQAVDVVIVDPPAHAADQPDPGEALALWLARHDVHPAITLLARTEPQVADLLTHFCRERGCEALVMGAFGHSRLREALLGGTTRKMLTSVPLPLVMAR